MILWHVGATLAVVRYVFRDPRMDLRWLALGAVLPDLVDKPIGSVLFDGTFRSGRLWAHALAFSALLLIVVMAASRRGSARRKALLGLPIGSLLHVFLDLHFTNAAGFWWPFLGLEFPAQAHSGIGALVVDQLTNPLVLAAEAAGLLYLAALYRRAGLADAGHRAAFLRTGRLPFPLVEHGTTVVGRGDVDDFDAFRRALRRAGLRFDPAGPDHVAVAVPITQRDRFAGICRDRFAGPAAVAAVQYPQRGMTTVVFQAAAYDVTSEAENEDVRRWARDHGLPEERARWPTSFPPGADG